VTPTAKEQARSIGKTALCVALRLGLGGLFAAAGVLKFGDVNAFAIEIHNYQLFPQLAPVLAATLPTIEIGLGAALIFGPRPWLRAGALGSLALLAAFTVAVVSVVARGIDITCGCFGEGSGPVTMVTVLRDGALLAAGLLLYWLAGQEPAVSPRQAEAGR
jgi:putative oxidoreductase